MWLIACKSDPTRLPKSWFLANNITEKLQKLSAWVGAIFFSKLEVFLAIYIQNHQLNSAMCVKKAVKATTDVKKSANPAADVKSLKINFDKL